VAGKGRQIFLIVQVRGRTLRAIIDSRATGNFIDTRVVAENGFKTFAKQELYSLFLVDGETIGGNKGIVTHETDRLTMKILKGYTEDIQFDIVAIGVHSVILGIPWLRLYNPQINWRRERIIIDQCRCTSNNTAPKGSEPPPSYQELYATSDKPEDLAQASVLTQIPAAYKEYEHLFREGPRTEALLKHQL
jgi:hypothetical protein